MSTLFKQLLDNNKSWAQGVADIDPDFFKQMAEGQKPEFLWIGCADSRAPAGKITNTLPGNIFVHRNVANLVVHNDFNMLSVLQYAVEVLKVKHVMVVGHYGCGGVKASMGATDLGLINKWVRHIKDVYEKYHEELKAIVDEKARTDKLCEFNATEQMRNLAKTTIIQKAWKEQQFPYLHACILELKSGKIKEIDTIAPGELCRIEDIYHYDV